MSGRPAGWLTPTICAALCLLTAPASAFQLFGFEIFGQSEDPDAIEILDPLPYQVSTTLDQTALGRSLLEVSNVWQRRDRPASGSAGLIVGAKADYRRLLAKLYTEGYYSGAINIRLNGREVAGLPNTEELSQPVVVEISIDPGPPFVFGQTVVENPPGRFALGDAGRPGTQQRLFTAGAPARADVIDEVGEEAIALWREFGHPKARVADRIVIADHGRQVLDTTIILDPGQSATFDRPVIRGSRTVRSEFIRHIADIDEGDRFNPQAMEDARRRLNSTGAFSSVRLEEGEEIGPDGQLPLTIAVQDRKPRRIGVGATFSSIDGIGAEAFWMHRNVFGRAERLRFDVEVGGIDPDTDVEDYDYLAAVSLRMPGFLDAELNLEVGVEAKQEDLDIYRERSLSTMVALDRRFTEALSGTFMLEATRSRIEDDLGDRVFRVFASELGVIYERRDNILDPTRGYYLEGRISPFVETRFDTFAADAEIDARGYLSFGEARGTVLAARVGLGTVIGNPDPIELPPDQLFFAGGGGSVRGYGFRSIGSAASDDTLGGLSLFEGSVELRQRVTERFGGVLFVDAGYVGDEISPFDGFDPRYGVGLGLRYNTDFGPIRLDVATPIDPRPGDPTIALYVGLGQAF